MRVVRLCSGMAILLTCIIGCAATEPMHLRHWEFGEPAKVSPRGQAYAHYIAAIMLERQGQFKDAVDQMSQVPELDAEAVTPTLRLIKAYIYRQDYEMALQMCERAIKQSPDRANLYIVLGEIYHQLHRDEDAVKAFSKAIEINPDNVLGYGALAELEESTNDLIAAIDIYEQLIEMQPDSAGLHLQLGINKVRIGDTEGAVKSLSRALELNPDLIRARYLLGVILLEENKPQESVDQLGKYIEKRPDDIDAIEALSGAFARFDHWPEAFTLIARVLQSSQVRPEHHIDGMYVLLRAGKPEAAEKVVPPVGAPIFGTVLTAIARKERGEPYLPLIESLDQVEGNLGEEAEAFLNELLYLYGKEQAGNWLLDQFNVFRQEGAKSKVLEVLYARILVNQGKHEEAVGVFENVISQYGADAELHYSLAVAYDELENFEATEQHLKAYLETQPDDPDVLNFIGYLYAEHAVKLDEAEALLKKALELDPDNPFYMDSLGWVYYQQKKGPQAVELIQQAIIKMDTDDAVLRDHLGDAYLLNGEVDKA
ncbi:MAG: tetratricopeptide repeat protein, partial [Candidatus Hydrogenedentes bacterium]|nr:tetratricopeptide repeat protein [Candidatus Hydrogenedentota bacterium]